MKIRIAILLLALMLPIKADALFIFDIGATPQTAANAANDAERAGTDVKKAKTFWKTLKSIGDGIRAVADFYSKAKAWVKIKYDKYRMYRDSVMNFIDQAERFYNSVMDAYAAVLDAAEYAAEIGQRIKAYIQEGKDIIAYGKEAVQRCQKIVTSGYDQIKALVDQKKEKEEQERRAREESERLQAEIAALEQQNSDEMSPEDRQRLAELQAELEEYQYQMDTEGTAQGYAEQLSKLNSQLQKLRQIKDELLAGNTIVEDEAIREIKEELQFDFTVNSVERAIQKIEANILVAEQKYRAASNSEYRQERIRQLEEERQNLQHHTESNEITNHIRDARDRLAIVRAEEETYKQYLQNIENQIFNYNRQVVDMVNDCRYRIQMTVARTKRLICNMTTGAMSQYASKFDSITGQLGNAANAAKGMDSEIENQQNMLKQTSEGTCAQLRSECQNGFGGVTAKAQEKSEEKRQKSCKNYTENCAQATTQEVIVIPSLAAGVPQCEEIVQNIKAAVTKYVDCALVKGQCMAEAATEEDKQKKNQACSIHCQHCGYIEGACLSSDYGYYGGDGESHVINQCEYLKIQCDILKNTMPDYEKMMDCVNWKENCSQADNSSNNPGPSAQQFSAVYSIHNASVIAQAAVDAVATSMTPTDTPEGEFIQPSSIANICELDNLDKISGLPECLGKFNNVKYAQTDTDIPGDMIEFYKALRGVKTSDETTDKNFNPKHQAEDAKIANKYMNDIYAEYLASAYFRGLNFYKKYFMYDLDVINPMQTSVGSDVGTSWASISLVEQELSSLIYDIYTMWSKEQLVGAVEGMVNNQISRESIQEAAKNDLQQTENSNE